MNLNPLLIWVPSISGDEKLQICGKTNKHIKNIKIRFANVFILSIRPISVSFYIVKLGFFFNRKNPAVPKITASTMKTRYTSDVSGFPFDKSIS